MRRHTTWIALAMATAFLTSACSSSGSSTPEETASPTATAAASTPTTDDDSESAAPDPLAPKPLAERATLRVGLAAYVEAFAPVLLANELGELEKENIEVEIFNALPSDVLLLLSQGKADVSAFAVDAGIFNAVERGIDIRWVSALLEVPDDTREGFIVSTDLYDGPPEEFDFSLLEGQSIAVPRAGLASAQTYDLMTALEKGGLTLDDVTLVPSSNPDHVTAIESGAVQAINAEVDPFASQIIDAGNGQLVQPLKDDIATGGYFMRAGLTAEEREVGEAFMRALIRTNETYLQPGYHDDPEVVAALSKVLDAPEDAIASAPEKVFSFPIPEGSFQTLQDMFLELGQVEYDEPLDRSQMVDESLVEAVLGS